MQWPGSRTQLTQKPHCKCLCPSQSFIQNFSTVAKVGIRIGRRSDSQQLYGKFIEVNSGEECKYKRLIRNIHNQIVTHHRSISQRESLKWFLFFSPSASKPHTAVKGSSCPIFYAKATQQTQETESVFTPVRYNRSSTPSVI